MEETTIGLEDALLQLPSGANVHTFRNPCGGLMLGADWERNALIEAMRNAPEILITGDVAQSMGHGLAINYRGSLLFIETAKP